MPQSEVIQVPEGLSAVVSRWQRSAVALAGDDGVPVFEGEQNQPSAQAVVAVAIVLGNASAKIAARTAETAAKVAHADAAFSAKEDAAVEAFDSV